MEKKSFEVLMSDLEKIVDNLENGDIELEKALEMYKKGIGIIEDLNKKLENARKQIETAGEIKNGETS